MEEINYLLGYKNLKIVQNTQMFKFSLDSILLPNFVKLNSRIKRVLDIGSGNCPIPLVLSTKTNAIIDAIEIQNDVYELGLKTIEINNLKDRINLINADVNIWYKGIETDYYDVIVCNPPYFDTKNKELLNSSDYKTLARHQQSLTIDDIMRISRKILKNNGVVAIVHRPDYLIDILDTMRKNNIEPKRLQFIYPKTKSEANTILVEGHKNGKKGLKLLPPLVIHNSDGSYSDEIKKYFE